MPFTRRGPAARGQYLGGHMCFVPAQDLVLIARPRRDIIPPMPDDLQLVAEPGRQLRYALPFVPISDVAIVARKVILRFGEFDTGRLVVDFGGIESLPDAQRSIARSAILGKEILDLGRRAVVRFDVLAVLQAFLPRGAPRVNRGHGREVGPFGVVYEATPTRECYSA